MNRQARHRGPDGEGVAEFGRVGFGHTRLSIIDVSDGGHQPMSRHGAHITFNGEIYNYAELRAELETAGGVFQTRSDTEVLLAGMAKWGPEGLHRLKGMFAFAFYDERDRTVLFVRDRFGKKPLVYTRQDGVFYAASEAKQIFAAQRRRAQLNAASALRYLELGYMNGVEETFFSDVYEVPAGHYLRLEVDSGQAELIRWYDLSSNIHRSEDTYETARERVRELLKASVWRRHVADVEVGACLSGGIDSSSIVSLSSTLFPAKRLRTITSFSTEPGYDERQYSRAVAEKFAIERVEVEPRTETLWEPGLHAEVAFYQEQPLAGGSQLNEYRVFEAGHRLGLKVMLDGQGADEYFGGYGEFWVSAQFELLRRGRFGDFLAGVSARAEAQGRSYHATLLGFVSALRAKSQATSQPTNADWLKRHAPSESKRRQGWQHFRDLSLEELSRSSVPFQVHSEDRSAMRWSVESRLPFLDHDLVEYVLSLPTAFKCRRGVQKAILRDAVEELPVQVARRRDKVGFASPDARYFFANSASIKASLAEAAERLDAFVEPEALMQRFCHVVDQRSSYSPVFLRVLALDGLVRAFDASI